MKGLGECFGDNGADEEGVDGGEEKSGGDEEEELGGEDARIVAEDAGKESADRLVGDGVDGDGERRREGRGTRR